MKKFIFKVFLFFVPIILLFVTSAFLVNGYSDAFYLRFTSPPQKSIILGTSRAAQGLIPQVFDSLLKNRYPQLQMFNFAFTLSNSPYGPLYYNAIKEKLDTTGKNGLFIVSVDPWSICAISNKKVNPEDSLKFRENSGVLSSVRSYNTFPNFYYLFKRNRFHILELGFNAIINRTGPLFLHENGWLEVSVPMDNASINSRTRKKVRDYRENTFNKSKFSNLRMKYLEKTIQLLKESGAVFLVRLPVCEEMCEIEKKLIPEFDSIMNEIAKENKIPYYNFIDSCKNYSYTDGNHIHKTSGVKFSSEIAKLILENKN